MKAVTIEKIAPTKLTDEQLVDQFIHNGEERAFAELLRRYKKKIFYFIQGKVHNKEDAEDIALETFAKAFVKVRSFDPELENKFSTWLYSIARHNCIDFYRKHRLMKEAHVMGAGMYENDEGDTMIHDLTDDALNPEEALLQKQRFRKLYHAMRELKPIDRKLIKMVYFKQLKYEEVAAETGLPVGTVKGKIHRAKHELHRLLHRYERLD